VLKRSKADGLEDESKPQQEEKVTFYVEWVKASSANSCEGVLVI
jgi:hypothetical protein